MTNASADENEYVPLVREGVVWEYVGHYQEWPEPGYKKTELYTLEFNGSFDFTNPDGVTVEYHNLYRTNYDDQGNAQEPYIVAVVSESGKVVNAYEYEYWWEVPDTIYNFNNPMFLPDMAFIGDSDSHCPYPYDLDNYKEFFVNVAGSIRKGYHINDDGIDNYTSSNEIKIIEGIGVDCWFGDLLVPYRDFSTGIDPMAGLSAVYENGELVYKGCAYDEAQELKDPDAISTIAGDKKVANVSYYNLAGVESAEPFNGINIKVTTYTDGTRKSEKVLK